MLRKRLGIEAIERGGSLVKRTSVQTYFKVPSTLIVPESCKRIGGLAFFKCENLRKVEIPKSIKEIGYSAFYRCVRATIILRRLKSEIEFIGGYAFECCRDVKEETRN